MRPMPNNYSIVTITDTFGVTRPFGSIILNQEEKAQFQIGTPVTAMTYGRKDLGRRMVNQFIVDEEKGCLGVGAFAKVYKAYPVDEDKNIYWHAPVAVKIFGDTEELNETYKPLFQAELNSHALYQVAPLTETTLLLPFLDAENLREYLLRLNQNDTRQRIELALQAAILLQIIHNYTPKGEPIIHFDLKDENILVTVGGKVFIIDFGLSLTAQKKVYNLHTLSIDTRHEIFKIFKEEIAQTREEKNTNNLQDEKIDAYRRKEKIAQFFEEQTLKERPVLMKIEREFFVYGCSENGEWKLSAPLNKEVCTSASKLIFLNMPLENRTVDIPKSIYKEILLKKAHVLPPDGRIDADIGGTPGWRAPELLKKEISGTSADVFAFGGLLASILGAVNVCAPRKPRWGRDGYDSEINNTFDVKGMLENDNALTLRQRQAILDYQKLMTDLDPENRKKNANSDLTVRFLNSVNQLLVLNTVNSSGDHLLQQQIKQQQVQHEARLILMSNKIHFRSLANELALMSVQGDIEINKILANNETLKNKPILFKREEQFIIYGVSPEGKWRLTPVASTNAFMQLSFSETPCTVLTSQYPAVMDEISKIGHTQLPENNLFKDFDFSANPLLCQAIIALDKAGVFSKPGNGIISCLLSDHEKGNAQAEAYLLLRKKQSSQFKEFWQGHASLISAEGAEFPSREQARLFETQEIAQKEYEAHSEQEAEKIKIRFQCRAVLIVKLEKAGLLTEKVVNDILNAPLPHIEAACRIKEPKIAYLYFYLCRPELISNTDLISALEYSFAKAADEKDDNNSCKRMLKTVQKEIFRRLESSFQAAEKNTSCFFFTVITPSDAKKALNCMKTLLEATLSVKDFLSSPAYSRERKVLMSRNYRQFTQPIFAILNKSAPVVIDYATAAVSKI